MKHATVFLSALLTLTACADSQAEYVVVKVPAKKPEGKCGRRQPITGSVTAREAFQKRSLDPASVEVLNCSDPTFTAEDCWVINCLVRNKNAYGETIAGRRNFSYREGVGNVRVLD